MAKHGGKSGGFSWTTVLLALLAMTLLTGCTDFGNETPKETLAIIAAILMTLRNRRVLQFRKGQRPTGQQNDKSEAELEEDRHRGFFIHKRALSYNVTASNQATVTNLIDDELLQVEVFATEMLTGVHGLEKAAPDGESGDALNAPFTAEPDGHLDLANAAVYRVLGQGQSASNAPKQLQGRYQTQRVRAAKAIIWRAAGIHPELWDPGATPTAPRVLNTDALHELLDRRLRVVERMDFQVNPPYLRNPKTREYTTSLVTAAGHNNWVDGSRVRIFEYPRFTAEDRETLFVDSSRANWELPTASPQTVVFNWQLDPGTTITTRVNPELNDSPTVSQSWPILSSKRAYERFFLATLGKPLSAALTDVTATSLNVWGRTWYFCDHVAGTLLLDALRFALRRRGQRQPTLQNGDDKIDAIGAIPEYVRIPATVGGAPLGKLADPTTWTAKKVQPPLVFSESNEGQWFRNLYISPSDLQVGDNLLFHNHLVYIALAGGDWKLEDSIVHTIDSDPENGSMDIRTIRLIGHGLTHSRLTGYARYLAGLLQLALAECHKAAEKLDAEPGRPKDNFPTTSKFFAFRWTPYAENQSAHAPWFVWIPRNFEDHTTPGHDNRTNYRTIWESLEAMVKGVSHSFIEDPRDLNPSINPLYRPMPKAFSPPPDFNLSNEGVIFPLYLPVVNGNKLEWGDYLAQRRAQPNQPIPYDLAPLVMSLPTVDEERKALQNPNANVDEIKMTGDIPGIFPARKRPLRVQVIRPTVRSTY